MSINSPLCSIAGLIFLKTYSILWRAMNILATKVRTESICNEHQAVKRVVIITTVIKQDMNSEQHRYILYAYKFSSKSLELFLRKYQNFWNYGKFGISSLSYKIVWAVLSSVKRHRLIWDQSKVIFSSYFGRSCKDPLMNALKSELSTAFLHVLRTNKKKLPQH